MSRELSDIERALSDGMAAAQGMRDRSAHWSGREAADGYMQSIKEGLRACEKLSRDLREGRKHVEPPDDYVHTSCYCSEPTCSPPCSWCTDPTNNDEP